MSIIESNKQQTNNSQRNAYQLTINNPLDYSFDHLTIKKTLVENFTTLRYFCMAAKNAGIKKVLIPARNKRDVEELSTEITKGLEIIPVEQMEEVLEHAFVRE